jgi:site-specific recombinase
MSLSDDIKELTDATQCALGSDECRTAIINSYRKFLEKGGESYPSCNSCSQLKSMQDRLKFLLDSKRAEQKRMDITLDLDAPIKKEQRSLIDMLRSKVSKYTKDK